MAILKSRVTLFAHPRGPSAGPICGVHLGATGFFIPGRGFAAWRLDIFSLRDHDALFLGWSIDGASLQNGKVGGFLRWDFDPITRRDDGGCRTKSWVPFKKVTL